MDFVEIAKAILVLTVGLIVGSYGSVVGGGGLISFPFLVLLGLPTAMAIGTARFGATFLEASSTIAFWRKNSIQWRLALPLGIVAVPASILGANSLLTFNESFLNVLVAAVLIILLFLIPKVKDFKPKKSKSKEIKYTSKQFLLLVAVTAALSFYGGFYGAGFGTFIMFPFILWAGSSFLEGSGNARFIGFLMSGAAALVFISEGQVDFSVGIPFLIGTTIGAQLGVKLAFAADSKFIKYALRAVIVLSIAKLIVETI